MTCLPSLRAPLFNLEEIYSPKRGEKWRFLQLLNTLFFRDTQESIRFLRHQHNFKYTLPSSIHLLLFAHEMMGIVDQMTYSVEFRSDLVSHKARRENSCHNNFSFHHFLSLPLVWW